MKSALLLFGILGLFCLESQGQKINGQWKIIDLKGDVQLKTLPISIMKKVKKGMVNKVYEYHDDGTYSKGFKEKTGGKYKVQNGEIYHYDFLENVSLKGRLAVNGDEMQIIVKREDFLNALAQNFKGKMTEEQLNSMYNISDEIVYVLKKM